MIGPVRLTSRIGLFSLWGSDLVSRRVRLQVVEGDAMNAPLPFRLPYRIERVDDIRVVV